MRALLRICDQGATRGRLRGSVLALTSLRLCVGDLACIAVHCYWLHGGRVEARPVHVHLVIFLLAFVLVTRVGS